MKKTLRLAVVLAFTLLAVVDASAAPMFTETFTLTNVTGPDAGNNYTGSFSWDPTSCCSLTAFTSNFPSAAGVTLAELSAAFAPYYSNPGLELFYAPAPSGNTNAFAFFGSNPYFTYGTTDIPNNDFFNAGDATVVYGPITGTPEPGTLVMLASGLVAAAGAVRRRLNA